MKTMLSIVAATVVTVGVGIAMSSATEAKTCVMAGGEATMVTGDLAQFMAKAALGNSIKGKGMTAVGPIKMKCNDPSPLTYCIATQKACK